LPDQSLKPGPAGTACPGCAAPMRGLALARNTHGEHTVDLCERCHALWFDRHESAQLGPAAILELFEAVHAAPPPARTGLPTRLPCPRCGIALADTHDLQRSTRFRYWRCPRGHGRFTPFVQFLREKDFMRPLSRQEVERLRAQVASVRCTGCGASVELARDMVCGYCRSPVEMLDPEAAARTLATLAEARHGRSVDVDRLADALLTAPAVERGANRTIGLDLLALGIGALVDWAHPD
jgi:hypothetical protein